jgi:GNAT superfamily N-acetyltransferase
LAGGSFDVSELTTESALARLPALVDLLVDAVADGASVGFMSGITRGEAEAFWRDIIAGIPSGRTHVFAALAGDDVLGVVLMHPSFKTNQPHRADVAKLLVLRSARRTGVASRLMDALEARAIALGRTLLTLDTATGSGAEDFYRRRGYAGAGVIPGYALMPDGAMTGTRSTTRDWPDGSSSSRHTSVGRHFQTHGRLALHRHAGRTGTE